MKRGLSAEERSKVFKALADPRRVDIIDLLASQGSLCGTELAGRLGISIALLCHHWGILIGAGLVKKQRFGQRRVCSFDGARLREATAPWEPSMKAAGPKPVAAKAAQRSARGARRA